MNPETLKKLSEISTTDHLRSAITDLCLPYGKVKKIDLIPLDQGTGYMCFVELDSTGRYASLTYELDGTVYGNSIAFKIPSGQRGN